MLPGSAANCAGMNSTISPAADSSVTTGTSLSIARACIANQYRNPDTNRTAKIVSHGDPPLEPDIGVCLSRPEGRPIILPFSPSAR